jgi:hypothetical protein
VEYVDGLPVLFEFEASEGEKQRINGHCAPVFRDGP